MSIPRNQLETYAEQAVREKIEEIFGGFTPREIRRLKPYTKDRNYNLYIKARNTIENTIQRAKALGQKVSSLDSQVTDLDNLVSSLEGRVSNLDAEVSDLDSIVDDAQARINQIQNQTIPSINADLNDITETQIPSINESINNIQSTIGYEGDPAVWTSEAMKLDSLDEFRDPPTGIFRRIWETGDKLEEGVVSHINRIIGYQGDPAVWTSEALGYDTLDEFKDPPTGMWKQLWTTVKNVEENVLSTLDEWIGFYGDPPVWNIAKRWSRLDAGKDEFKEPPTGMWKRINKGISVVGYPGLPRVWKNPDTYTREPTGMWKRIDQGIDAVEGVIGDMREEYNEFRNSLSNAFENIQDHWSNLKSRLESKSSSIKDIINNEIGTPSKSGTLLYDLKQSLEDIKDEVGYANIDFSNISCGASPPDEGKGLILTLGKEAHRFGAMLQCLSDLIEKHHIGFHIACSWDVGTDIYVPRPDKLASAVGHGWNLVHKFDNVQKQFKDVFDELNDVPVIVQKITGKLTKVMSLAQDMAMMIANGIMKMTKELVNIDFAWDPDEAEKKEHKKEEMDKTTKYAQEIIRPPKTITVPTPGGRQFVPILNKFGQVTKALELDAQGNRLQDHTMEAFDSLKTTTGETPSSGVDHSDTSHADTHSNVAHSDTPHGDTSHSDSHSDVAHGDTHSDSSHSDSHSDTHNDTHSDMRHGDMRHNDFRRGRRASLHIDRHSDIAHADSHSDTAHANTHGDIKHSDYPHSDTAHTDTHSDSAHADTGGYEEPTVETETRQVTLR